MEERIARLEEVAIDVKERLARIEARHAQSSAADAAVGGGVHPTRTAPAGEIIAPDGAPRRRR
ncbi:hypothetical protein [Duganella sp. CF517]|uniref:hypothetical protein n=1 Tax=Duganella sp. CF517 TaxID=1881038 RepID=UPI0011607213|nr:hypothetical protein [Duganella sp. CF517]